jgi:predicted ArsR family transcriptional regulator
MLRKQLLENQPRANRHTSPRGALTVDDLASKMGLTSTPCEHKSRRWSVMVLSGASAAGPEATRPSHLFELTPEVEQRLSQAYIPLLTHLVGVFAGRLPADQLATLLRQREKASRTNWLPENLFREACAPAYRSRANS